MNTLILVVLTSCPVAADPVWGGQPPKAVSYDGNVSRPGLFSRLRNRFRRSPQGNDNAPLSPSANTVGANPVYVPAPPPVTPGPIAPSVKGPGPFRYPTTTEPPLAADSGPSLMPPPGR